MRYRGKVKWFDEKRGYGFISQPGEAEDCFVHFSGIEDDGFRTLKQDQEVEFDIVEGGKGLKAINVRKV